jgi:hypothetical protein
MVWLQDVFDEAATGHEGSRQPIRGTHNHHVDLTIVNCLDQIVQRRAASALGAWLPGQVRREASIREQAESVVAGAVALVTPPDATRPLRVLRQPLIRIASDDPGSRVDRHPNRHLALDS